MDIERIKKNIVVSDDGCWLWQRSCTSAGYGQLTENKKYWTAHVYAYSCVNRPPRKGQVVRHSCHTRRCCNPDHLAIGSHADNWRDSELTHLEAAKRGRYVWVVGDKTYPTFRAAVSSTGISSGSMVKFSTAGVFDVDAYRAGCRRAGWRPKV